MIIYIYKNTTLIAKPQAETMEEFKKNPVGFYPAWTNDLTASDIEFRHPKLVDGVLTEKTIEELKIEGLEPLNDGEKIVDNKLVTVPKIEGLKVMWNGSEWIETATPEEIYDYNWKEEARFYNKELEFASKAVAELECDIISQEDFEDVKLYMQSIDPYAQNYKRTVKNKRPSIFDRYN